LNLFRKKKYVSIEVNKIREQEQGTRPSVPDGLWIKCPSCNKSIYSKEIGKHKICPKCGGCFRLTAFERIGLIADEGSFSEINQDLSVHSSSFPGYEEKINKLKIATGLNDAVVTGTCGIEGNAAVLGVMDSTFIMGSMGAVVGEKLARAFEYALEKRLPVIIFTASGGARMQEGIISLMQMAKISAAAKRHSDAGLLYITVLTDPTTGGVTASFAMLGDIILSEPKALIGFAGRRVIEQTIRQKLPEDFQTAEFLMEHGFIDNIVKREDMKDKLSQILRIHSFKGEAV